MWYVIIAIVLVLLALGIIHWVRRQIASSRAQLKNVDRSKLKNLDDDAWAQEQRRDDE